MNRSPLMLWLAVAACGVSFFGCTQHRQTNTTPLIRYGVIWDGQYQEQDGVDPMMRIHRPISQWPLPNVEGGIPLQANFYRIDDHFPAYLLCSYTVSETPYDPSKEEERFRDSLAETRRWGSGKFPPTIKCVAVIIRNRAEHKTFEQSFKVGAVFKADDVFNHWRRLSRLVSEAEVDHHPFKYDPEKASSDQDQRWLIVERHAATNHPAASSP